MTSGVDPGRASRWWVLVALALLVGLVIAPPARSTPARTVLLVHGFGSSSAVFTGMAAALAARGIASIAVDLPGQDNVANADAIAELIRSRELATVDIVAHSMGGLASRWYLAMLGGAEGPRPRVERYVSLGTPQYGLAAACSLPPVGGGQMCPGSAFLAQLNDGDDTPGSTVYTTIASTHDRLVPVDATRLDGGACVVEVSGVGHFDLRTDPAVFDLVTRALAGECPGTFLP